VGDTGGWRDSQIVVDGFVVLLESTAATVWSVHTARPAGESEIRAQRADFLLFLELNYPLNARPHWPDLHAIDEARLFGTVYGYSGESYGE
jgi:hypothetical protein